MESRPAREPEGGLKEGDTLTGSNHPVRRPVAVASVFVIALLLAVSAGAQERYNFTATLMGGLGGSTDADLGDGIDNLALQLGLDFVTEPRTHVGFRLGTFDLESDDRFGSLVGASLTYATIAGEYRFSESFYESGVYLGLGGYQLDGRRLGGGDEDETTLGVAFGITGEFKVGRRFSIPVELSGHYADFEDAQVFVVLLTGVAFHFK